MELFIGPMYSGKTELLIKTAKKIAKKEKCLIIKYYMDDRYGDVNKLISKSGDSLHSTDNIRIVNAKTLSDISDFIENVIFIDEGQFYPDLYEFCMKWINLDRRIFISSLNGDYKRENFGQTSALLSQCDKITHLLSKCSYCGAPAPFTCKIIKNEAQVEVGGEDKYKASCRKCYTSA